MNIFSHFGRSSRKSSTSKKPARLGEKLGKNRLAIEALEERQLLDAAGFETLPDVITIAEPNSYHFAYEGTPIDFVDSSSVDGLTASFVTGDQVAFTIMKTSTDGAVSSLGEVTIQLFNNEAPNSVSHFEQLVWEDYYEGLTFHRIYPGFMFQGGSSDGHGYYGSDLGPIADEYLDVLTHSGRGMVAYANAGPNTSDAQFYITFDAADWLDGGYNVFGFVVDGYDVIDIMEAAEVVANERGELSWPVDTYTIENVRFVENPTQSALRIVADGNANGVTSISFSSSQADDALAFQETTVYVGEDGFEAYAQDALANLNISVEAGSSLEFSLPEEFGGYSISYSVSAEDSDVFDLIDLGKGRYRVVTDSSAVSDSEESVDFDFTVSASLPNRFNASNLSGSITVTRPEQIDNPPVFGTPKAYDSTGNIVDLVLAGRNYTIDFSASDPEGIAEIVYELVGGNYPEFFSFDAVTGIATLSIPEDYVPSDCTFVYFIYTVKATERKDLEENVYETGKSTERTLEVAIFNANYVPNNTVVPVWKSIDAQETWAGETFGLTVEALTPASESYEIRYSLVGEFPDGMVINPEIGTIRWNVPSDYFVDENIESKVLTIGVKATVILEINETGLIESGSSTTTFELTVKNPNYVPSSEPISWSLTDYPAQKSYSVDANAKIATLYGLGKNGELTELATSTIGTDGTLTITGQDRVAETICVTASAMSSLSAINFDGGDGARDAIYVETMEGNDVITIGTEVSETSTPLFARNPYEKALARYAKLFGENSAQYARIKASYDAAFGRLSRFVRTTRSTSGLISLEGGATLKFSGVKDVAIDSRDGNDVFKANNLGFNYVLTGGSGVDTLDFSGTSNRVEVELGSTCRQRPIKGDCGTLRLTDALEGFVGTARGDRVVASAYGAAINGGGGADSVVLAGGSNLVALTGAGQSVSISGSGQYFVNIEDGDRSIVNARGAKSGSTVSLDVEGDDVEVFGGRGAVEATIAGDRAKLNLSNASNASVFVSGDLARIEIGSGNDFVSVTGAGASVELGAGNDVAFLSDGTSGRFGGSRIDGGSGNDFIFAANASGSNVFRTGSGNDVVIGGAGSDEIRADSGNNVLLGMNGADSIYGGRGRDLLVGSRTTNLADVETELVDVETSYRYALLALYEEYYMAYARYKMGGANRTELEADLTCSEVEYRASVDYLYADIYANWSDATDLDVLGTESISDGSKDVVKRGSNLDATILDPEDVERGANGYDWGFWRW
ncbi:MAG: peptidylprolyl isomerase [Thermoguttaceae bacterium]|nr:peptidylprolyl isomerase [Thermoguttaceae bacterium]